jgi:NAD-dependent dihydropyrimidine dehydrogenase PreA subunit
MENLVYLKDVVTLSLDSEKCSGCGMCLSVCPRDVLTRSNGNIAIAERDRCIECGGCQRNCPQGALTVRTGVGCAAAVINQMLGRKGACCVIEDGCGIEGGSGRSTCC